MKIDKKRFEKIYQQVADDSQTNVEQVKTDMQFAIDEAWNSNNDNFIKLFPNGKPTLEEFLITIKDKVSQNDTY